MKPDCQIIHGDCRAVLAKLPEKSVHMCVTSPPYHGLRRYEGVEPSVWGGDFKVDNAADLGKQCQHEWGDSGSLSFGGEQGATGQRADRRFTASGTDSTGQFCRRCSAWKGLLGLEPTIDQYCRNIVKCMRAVKRVLRDDGTLWLNLGDSYVTQPAGNKTPSGFSQKSSAALSGALAQYGTLTRPPQTGLPSKNLIGQPWRVAFALQADGWYLRSDIIWHKPNPMPESVSGSAWVPHKVHVKGEDGETEYTECPGCEICNPNDGYVLRWGAGRPTDAHEHLFLLTKKPKYYYDAEAVRETGEGYGRGTEFRAAKYTENRAFNNSDDTHPKRACGHTFQGGRNKRSVWTIPTEANPEAHFASFPRRLVLPCVLAGTSEKGACPECGSPWVRVLEKDRQPTRPGTNTKIKIPGGWAQSGSHTSTEWMRDRAEIGNRDHERHVTDVKTLGWRAGCECFDPTQVCPLGGNPDDYKFIRDPIPCTVLDPFVGSGTAGIVATQQGRAFIGIDASAEYCEMARRRIADPEPEPTIEDAPGQYTMFEEATA